MGNCVGSHGSQPTTSGAQTFHASLGDIILVLHAEAGVLPASAAFSTSDKAGWAHWSHAGVLVGCLKNYLPKINSPPAGSAAAAGQAGDLRGWRQGQTGACLNLTQRAGNQSESTCHYRSLTAKAAPPL